MRFICCWQINIIYIKWYEMKSKNAIQYVRNSLIKQNSLRNTMRHTNVFYSVSSSEDNQHCRQQDGFQLLYLLTLKRHGTI